jgi:hypothetical protein
MPLLPFVVVPVSAAALTTALAVAALHVPLRHAMRERGLGRWRWRDTLLTSPLFVTGSLLAGLAANHGMLRLASDTQHHAGGGLAHAAGSLAAVCAGVLMAAFGLRAVAKLF